MQDLDKRLHSAADTVEPRPDLYADVRRRLRNRRRRPAIALSAIAVAATVAGLLAIPHPATSAPMSSPSTREAGQWCSRPSKDDSDAARELGGAPAEVLGVITGG